MDPLVERMAEGVAGQMSRRGLISLTVRGLVGLGLASVGLFGGKALALPPISCNDHFGSGNTCSVGSGFCHNHEGNHGCGGYANCDPQYCEGTTSNCSGGAVDLPGTSWWDCCCEGVLSRCRDCEMPNNQGRCICNNQNYGTC
jgi:hypothetical protein